MHFLDEAKIYIKAGYGGPGCVSFRREKFVEFGGPDGGNGGKGGDVIFQAAKDNNTLIDFRYKQHFRARAGESGQGKNKTGASGKDLIISVPVGTQIIASDGYTMLADLTKDEEQFFIARGGNGGVGNAFYKSSINRAPKKSTPGWPGEEMWVWLKLKLLADAGLVGMPNAGKSTFLSKISKARPKIADYPFTTLQPNLGVVEHYGHGLVIADVPGLIEGASLGTGLGHRFLKHIERCKMIVHFIDGTDNDVVAAYKKIRQELQEYSVELIHKPELPVLNKIDLLSGQELENKLQELKQYNADVIGCSAFKQGSIEQTLKSVFNLLY